MAGRERHSRLEILAPDRPGELARLVRVTHRHRAHITHRHRIEVRDMSCTEHTLVIPRLQHFASDTTPVGLVVRLDDDDTGAPTYLDGSGLAWAANATNLLTGSTTAPWSSVSVAGAVGDENTPSVAITMLGVALGLYLVALVGTSGAVRREVRFELEVV
jgi:hypothetical protein